MKLLVEPSTLTMPIVGAAEGRVNAKRIRVQGQTYWDVIYALAVRYGFIIFVRDLDVVLTRPNDYLESRQDVYKMVWGRNVSEVSISRKIGRETAPTVEVRSYDDTKREILKARFPKNAPKTVDGTGSKKEEIAFYTLPGIKEQAHLEKAAENIYNALSRSEQEMSITTRDLVDAEGNSLLIVSAGDSMTFEIDSETSPLLETKSAEKRKSALRNLGYTNEQMISGLAQAVEDMNYFKTPFRVKAVEYNFSADDGIEIRIELQKIVNVAEGVTQ